MEINSRKKEHYGFTYSADFDAMFRRKALFIKCGDAFNTEERWQNQDIAGANEATPKIPVYVYKDLEGINRDYDYRGPLSKVWPQSHPELTGRGNEWHGIPVSSIPQELLKNYNEYAETNFSKATLPILDWAAKKAALVFAKFSSNNAKRKVSLRKLQVKIIKRIINLLRKKGIDNTIIAELAPRFGKTIFFLSLFLEISKEFGHNVMLVPAYWLPAIASFRKEVTRWRDYQDMVFVDTIIDTDWVKKTETALKNNQLTVIGVSLYADYDDFVVKHQWIHDYTEDILVVGDEADYGSHTKNQQEKIAYLFANKKVTFIPSSGTNLERMSKGAGEDVIDVISVPYSLMEQSGDPGIVKREMFQMYVSNRLQELVEKYSDEDRPAWSKLLEKAFSNQDFLVGFFKAIYGYSPEYGMTLDGAAEDEILVSMIFVSITNDAMAKLVKLLEKYLPDHYLYVINGEEMSGRDAEEKAKDVLRQVKHGWINKKKVIFITNMMASRSFSVGDIQATIFLKDGGSLDTFTQQALRVVTPLDPDETILVEQKTRGYIFSFAFDVNRDRLDQLQILYEAKKVSEFFEEEGMSLTMPQAIAYVLNSMNLKEVGFLGDGRIVNVTADMLMKEFEDTEKALRVAGITTDYDGIKANAELMELALKCAKMKPAQEKKIKEILKKGKVLGGGTAPKFTKNEEKLIMKELIGAMNSIIYSSTTVLQFSNFKGTNFKNCLEIIGKNESLDENFQLLYNLYSSEVLKFLLYLPTELLDISVFNAIKEHNEICG